MQKQSETDNKYTNHSWQLTINNPKLEDFIVYGDSINDRIKNIVLYNLFAMYFAYCVEKETTEHIHLYIYFHKNANYFDKFKKYIPTAHIEPCKGSFVSNRNYLLKNCEYKMLENGKIEIIKGNFYEYGILPIKKNYSGYNTNSELLSKIELLELKLYKMLEMISVNNNSGGDFGCGK